MGMMIIVLLCHTSTTTFTFKTWMSDLFNEHLHFVAQMHGRCHMPITCPSLGGELLTYFWQDCHFEIDLGSNCKDGMLECWK